MEVSSIVNEYIIVFRHNKVARDYINSWMIVNPFKPTKRFKDAYCRMIKRARANSYKMGYVTKSIKPDELQELCDAMYETLT